MKHPEHNLTLEISVKNPGQPHSILMGPINMHELHTIVALGHDGSMHEHFRFGDTVLTMKWRHDEDS